MTKFLTATDFNHFMMKFLILMQIIILFFFIIYILSSLMWSTKAPWPDYQDSYMQHSFRLSAIVFAWLHLCLLQFVHCPASSTILYAANPVSVHSRCGLSAHSLMRCDTFADYKTCKIPNQLISASNARCDLFFTRKFNEIHTHTRPDNLSTRYEKSSELVIKENHCPLQSYRRADLVLANLDASLRIRRRRNLLYRSLTIAAHSTIANTIYIPYWYCSCWHLSSKPFSDVRVMMHQPYLRSSNNHDFSRH